MPSTENDVMNGIAPASEIWPLESCWTPCASVATTIGLVLFVARKLSASLLMSWPEMELSIVARSRSITGRTAVTSIFSLALAICSCVSARTIWRASSSTLRVASAKPCRRMTMT